MESLLTSDQRQLAQLAVASGHLENEEAAVREALDLGEKRERSRQEVLAALEIADASLQSGEDRKITAEQMRQLAESVKERGRQRLALETTRSL